MSRDHRVFRVISVDRTQGTQSRDAEEEEEEEKRSFAQPRSISSSRLFFFCALFSAEKKARDASWGACVSEDLSDARRIALLVFFSSDDDDDDDDDDDGPPEETTTKRKREDEAEGDDGDE